MRLLVTVLALLVSARVARADNELPAALRSVAIDQRLNEQVPLDLVFRNERGETVLLGDLFHGKPVILVLAYYRCPMLCTLVLNGLVQALDRLSFGVGEEFSIVTVSFDPRDTPELAAAKKLAYIERYGRANAANGWHFLTGDRPAIDRLTDAVGFRYSYDATRDQFAHASGIMVMTPQGRIARYFFGVEYSSRDLRLALVEASANRIGSPIDQVMLF
jgi:protein SCO1/2